MANECEVCGCSNEADAIFCRACGAKLGAVEPTTEELLDWFGDQTAPSDQQVQPDRVLWEGELPPGC